MKIAPIIFSFALACSLTATGYSQESATQQSTDILSQSLVGYTQFTESTPQPVYGTNTSGFTYADNKLSLNSGSINSNVASTGSTTYTTISVALRLNMSTLAAAVTASGDTLLFSFLGSRAGNNDKSTTPYSGVYVVKEDNGTIKLRTDWMGNTTHAAEASSEPVPSTGGLNVVLTVGGTDAGTTLYLSQGDNPDYTANQTVSSAGLLWSSNADTSHAGNVPAILFDATTAPAIEQLYVFNTTLNTDQVQETMAAMTSWASPVAVPEPAVSILTLLGIYGIWMRRKK